MNCFNRVLRSWTSHKARKLHVTKSTFNRVVLGIETSCDETGAAVVDENGTILGEALHSQQVIHLRNGGIIPPVARDLHNKFIEEIVEQALSQSNIPLQDISALATTVKPGLSLSLTVGLNYSKKLLKESGIPFIPIHHMEAHALTVRMVEEVDFPFLVFLTSGGHCQLALVRNVDDFLLLGSSLDDGPGEAFDKTARRLKLTNIPDCAKMSGGQAIEFLASKGDPLAFHFPAVMSRHIDCNFSFSGLKFAAFKITQDEEKKYGIEADGILPNVADICASFQYGMARHLAKRLQRAIIFCEINDLFPQDKKTVVLSGGVARNTYIKSVLAHLCTSLDCRFLCPPPKLCTDNGVMIAWNGMEKLKLKTGIVDDPENVQIIPRCSLGKDISEDVARAALNVGRFKMPVIEHADKGNMQSTV